MDLLSSTCQSVHPTVPSAPSIRRLQRPSAQPTLVTMATLLPVACVLVRIVPPCMCNGREDDDIKHTELCFDGNFMLITLVHFSIL